MALQGDPTLSQRAQALRSKPGLTEATWRILSRSLQLQALALLIAEGEFPSESEDVDELVREMMVTPQMVVDAIKAEQIKAKSDAYLTNFFR